MLICLCICAYGIQIVAHTITKVPEADTIAILGFHNVVSDEEKDLYYAGNVWVDDVSSFSEKMDYLYEQGYETWTLDELYAWKQGKKEKEGNVIVLTFDDGYYASSHLIAPILERYGFQATTFVVGSFLAGPHVWDASYIQYMNAQDMEDQSIMSYYSHTYALHDKQDGTFLVDMKTKEELQKDLDLQKTVTSVDYLAYPYGHYNEKMIDVLQENGVKLAFGYNENIKASRMDNAYTLPRFAITSNTSMASFQAMLDSERSR